MSAWNVLIGEEEVAKYANLRVPIVADVSESVLPALRQEPRGPLARWVLHVCDTTYYPDPEDFDEGESIPEPYTKTIGDSYFADALRQATHMFVVYDAPGPNIGAYALLDANAAELWLMCSRVRGKRYGGLLMAKCQSVLRAAGKTQMVLYASNSSLLPYYQSLGFQVEGERGKSKYDTTKMTKSLVRPVSSSVVSGKTYKAALTGTSRKLRLQKQTRRAKRNTRNHKGRKLRKFTTRRR
jgi:hypothetical protein